MVKLASVDSQKGSSSMQIRDLLKRSEVRITELAKYFHVSRTTLYQDMRSYDRGQFRDVRHDVLCLFNYLRDNPGIAKAQIFGHAFLNQNMANKAREPSRSSTKEKEVFIRSVLANFVDIISATDIDDIAEIAKILARRLNSNRASSL